MAVKQFFYGMAVTALSLPFQHAFVDTGSGAAASRQIIDIIIVSTLLPLLQSRVNHLDLFSPLEALAQAAQVLPTLDRTEFPQAMW